MSPPFTFIIDDYTNLSMLNSCLQAAIKEDIRRIGEPIISRSTVVGFRSGEQAREIISWLENLSKKYNFIQPPHTYEAYMKQVQDESSRSSIFDPLP